MQLKITQIKYINVIFFISIIIGYQFDGTGYSNIYAINKISNQSLIKLPFRLLSYDLSISGHIYPFFTGSNFLLQVHFYQQK